MKPEPSRPRDEQSTGQQSGSPDTSESYAEWRDRFAGQRLWVLYLVGLIANPVFSILDILIHPEALRSLFLIRVFLEFGLLIGLLSLRQQLIRLKPPVLLAFWILWPNALVVHMTLLTGGFSSQYYNGLSLVFLAAAVIVPVSWRSHLTAQVGTLLYYYTANLISQPGGADAYAAIQNSFFLVWTCVALIISVSLYERLQQAEFKSRLAERSARKELEGSHRKLLELDRLKSEFFANISHELRTPLTLILGMFKTLQKFSSTPESQELLHTGLRNTSRLLSLINELLELARFDSGRVELNRRCVDFTTLIRNVAANFESSERRRVHYRGMDQPVAIEADPRQIKKVLYNLLSNAFKFCDSEEGQVWLKLRATETTAELEVEDNGIGIPREHWDRIFDRFTQVESSATRRFEGSGIGLALVKEVVTLHKGTIAVESEPGRGSIFTMTLPRGAATLENMVSIDEEETILKATVQAGAEAPLSPDAIASPSNRDLPSVIVADDNADMRTYLARMLRTYYRILLAKDGVEALELVRSNHPDLILTDAMMPRMSGYDLLKAVRDDQTLRMIPIIFLTARAGSDARVETLEAGADDYIAKPFDEQEVLARVGNLIRGRRQERELLALQKEKLARFLPSQLGDLILSGTAEDFLKGHRREVTVVFIDLRGFTAFAETAEPEDVIAVLREYQATMGPVITEHKGTVERFSGDAMMIFLNDPVPVQNHPEQAIRMALAMRNYVIKLQEQWMTRGFELGGGIGLATGNATLGVIGFEGRKDYAAIGTVTNLAARLCGEAQHGQILISDRLMELVKDVVCTEPVGTLNLKGFRRPVSVHNVTGLKE